MSKLVSSLAFASTLLCLSCLSAAPASAYSIVTYVSGKGVDTGACATPATTCRTFQFAFNQTFPGGEIKALDAADYSPVTINRSVSISGVEGAGIVRFTAGNAITINAGATGVVSIADLTVDGFNKTATTGIKLNSAASLTIRNCTARNFSGPGIDLVPTTALRFLIADVVAADNGSVGVHIFPASAAGSTRGVLDHVVAARNNYGIFLDRPTGATVDVTAVDSVVSENSADGFYVALATTLRLSHSTVTKNNLGTNIFGTAFSAGNNFFNGNGADVAGALTVAGTQ